MLPNSSTREQPDILIFILVWIILKKTQTEVIIIINVCWWYAFKKITKHELKPVP